MPLVGSKVDAEHPGAVARQGAGQITALTAKV